MVTFNRVKKLLKVGPKRGATVTYTVQSIDGDYTLLLNNKAVYMCLTENGNVRVVFKDQSEDITVAADSLQDWRMIKEIPFPPA